MADRPVFVPYEKAPFYRAVIVGFAWNGGFAKSQKQKNVKAIHEAFIADRPGMKVLEISSKSMQEHGEDLSAFFLKKYVPSLDKKIPVECVFQAAKTFRLGGPYTDLLEVTPREAERDERLKNSGRLTCFTFEGKAFPLEPKTAFYDYIYLNALLENEELAETVLQYDAFTDVEFNPEKSLNCQAKSAAAFAALSRMGLTDKIKDFDSFLGLYNMPVKPDKPQLRQEKKEKPAAPETPAQLIQTVKVRENDSIIHKAYGKGRIVKVDGGSLVAAFPGAGQKTLSLEWCVKNCSFEQP